MSSIEENEDEFHNSFKSSKSSNSPLSEKNSSIFVYENFSFQENQHHKLQDSYEILKNMHGCNEDYNIKIKKQKPQQQLQYQQQQKQNRFLQFEQQEDDAEETINFQFLKNQQQKKYNKKSKSNKQNNFQQMLHLNDNEQEPDEELQQILDNFFEDKDCQYSQSLYQ
ncbi:unnamed protein product [Paramecium primaurelia]|uniref:Uncharacterized protein n=1 Tax=Paramecium primaurelia TaxID=5886 RepID=A0A8S1NZV6_PARPR|nr:unnamed protein product [Paramecium primaurelia]